jgi:predicted exporter
MDNGSARSPTVTEKLTLQSAEKPATALPESLADDLLQGAEAIANFLYGDVAQRRRVYHLVHNNQLPVFRMGVTLCARKSRLLAWIEHEETKATVART